MVILWFHFPFYINFLFYYKKALSFSFIHLSSGWAHGFLFYSVSYNPLFPLFMLVLRLSQLCTVSTYSYFLYPVILSHIHHFMSTFLLLGISTCTFPASALESIISPRSHILFSGEQYTHSYMGAKKNASRSF